MVDSPCTALQPDVFWHGRSNCRIEKDVICCCGEVVYTVTEMLLLAVRVRRRADRVVLRCTQRAGHEDELCFWVFQGTRLGPTFLEVHNRVDTFNCQLIWW